MAGRTAALAAVALGLMGVGAVARLQWPDSAPALDCAPEAVRIGPEGIATCGEGLPPAGAQALALGRRLDLNTATAEELALLPGVGPSLARRLVEVREDSGGFTSWDDVDAVPGVGSAKLQTLQAATVLGASPDAGPVW
ncbi:helix-hairpin-helix domain-containing protein [Pyxidicoccus fallax]|uniref:Helix-hairpin-helix domain-containing protein n=1 Tax=Pyxidicoccus fallax TaxID=394095 RepID=A0A848LZ42_9BACT|nr:helix-hairpin-helix domain-containing protein [Pyxidicoccus fallax]NMO22891.1 helix-hairpin-helix domain-containing protein [Pyxidicoccus fallax]NPC85169.1 helix-hairpin-helix domain-containing protein [Pyxidicoccus fallax]